MKVIETSIVIEASAEHVWMVLTYLNKYTNWNPFIVFAGGHLLAGQTLWFRRAIDITSILKSWHV